MAFDVKRNVRTLPLIYTLKQLTPAERRIYLRSLKGHARRGRIAQLKKEIVERGGLDYARERIGHFGQAALKSLDRFPDSKYKAALINVVSFNLQRSW